MQFLYRLLIRLSFLALFLSTKCLLILFFIPRSPLYNWSLYIDIFLPASFLMTADLLLYLAALHLQLRQHPILSFLRYFLPNEFLLDLESFVFAVMYVVPFDWNLLLVEVEAFICYELFHYCEEITGFEELSS